MYLFYDTDFKFLSLGKLSALKEIEWLRTVGMSASPALKYYYMGFYIPNCPKMRYKVRIL